MIAADAADRQHFCCHPDGVEIVGHGGLKSLCATRRNTDSSCKSLLAPPYELWRLMSQELFKAPPNFLSSIVRTARPKELPATFPKRDDYELTGRARLHEDVSDLASHASLQGEVRFKLNPNRKDHMQEWINVLRAADTAARWHTNQRRKGSNKEPYINHLLDVASMVATATEGEDPNLVIAALLHDAIEDQNIPREVIAEDFGEDVASLVVEVTDNKSLPKPERKRLQIETAPKKTPRAKLLKIADKISNMNSVAISPPEGWPVERRLEYVVWSRTVVAALGPDVHAPLRAEFALAADRAEVAARSQ